MEIKKLLKENFYLAVLFVIATSFFITQHLTLLSWDFSSYVMNARYLFGSGDYFEVYRAPLAPLLLSTTNIFGVLGEYIFIIQVSIIFLFACISFSDTIWKIYPSLKQHPKNLVRTIFYLTILTPFTLFYGTQAGTELLALSFLILFLAEYLKNNLSGHILALGFLSRYNLLFFIPLLLINKNYKKIIKNILVFIALITPWLIFNFIKFGNFFASVIDSYALNVYFRELVTQPFNSHAPFEVIGLSLTFVIFGLVFTLAKIKNHKLNKTTLATLLIIAVAALIVKDYASTPFKITRYLFNLALPTAFFATFGIVILTKLNKKLKIIIVCLLIFLFAFQTTTLFAEVIKARESDNIFYNSAKDIKALGLESCQIRSPHWVPVRYLAGGIIPLGAYPLQELIDQKGIALIFTNNPTVDDSFAPETLASYPKIYETKEYMFIGYNDTTNRNCIPRETLDAPYAENHCEIVSEKFNDLGLKPFALKTCQILNFEESNL